MYKISTIRDIENECFSLKIKVENFCTNIVLIIYKNYNKPIYDYER